MVNQMPALNYFNYFTEIEERFQQRARVAAAALHARLGFDRDWRDAGIPRRRRCAASTRPSTSTRRGKSEAGCATSMAWPGARRR